MVCLRQVQRVTLCSAFTPPPLKKKVEILSLKKEKKKGKKQTKAVAAHRGEEKNSSGMQWWHTQGRLHHTVCIVCIVFWHGPGWGNGCHFRDCNTGEKCLALPSSLKRGSWTLAETRKNSKQTQPQKNNCFGRKVCVRLKKIYTYILTPPPQCPFVFSMCHNRPQETQEKFVLFTSHILSGKKTDGEHCQSISVAITSSSVWTLAKNAPWGLSLAVTFHSFLDRSNCKSDTKLRYKFQPTHSNPAS